MRRAINWLVVLLSLVFLIVGSSLPGCAGSGGARSSEIDPSWPANAALRPARNTVFAVY